jgi:hypothetical protein
MIGMADADLQKAILGDQQESINQCIKANTNPDSGPQIWNIFNASAFLIMLSIIFLLIGFGLQQAVNIKEVQAHWKDYRCLPSIMPFAALYGYDTAENFEFCIKHIFDLNANELTAPFTTILSAFATVLSTIGNSMNMLRQAVASLGGGIFVIFQDFTDRITNFFFQLRLSAIRIKNLLGRMYATLFSVMYMGLSGMTAASNFSHTELFNFLDTFCFVPETLIEVEGKGPIPIYKVRIGDRLLPTNTRVTAKFHFSAQGQAMVNLGGIQVSTNHYILYDSKWIRAEDHPDAQPIGPYERQSLICLNTESHCIPIGPYVFRDYDETSLGDKAAMALVEERLNGTPSQPGPYTIHENSPTLHPSAEVKLANGTYCQARHLQVNDRLSTGSTIAGIFHKEVSEVCPHPGGFLGSATLLWKKDRWTRVGTVRPTVTLDRPAVYIGLIVLTNSTIELRNGDRIRDYLELCSPDTEVPYVESLANCS